MHVLVVVHIHIIIYIFVSYSRQPSGSNSESTCKSSGAKKTDAGTDFDPSKANFHPVDDACWKRGEK